MRKSFLILFISLIYLSTTCDNDSNVIGPSLDQFIYPIKIGNEWNYKKILFFSNVRLTVDNYPIIEDTSISSIIIKVTNEKQLHDSINTYIFNSTLYQNGSLFTDESYYVNQKDGLYFYGYNNTNPGINVPKIKATKKIYFNGYYFHNIKELEDLLIKATSLYQFSTDTIIYENPPLLVLKYPLEINDVWTYRNPNQSYQISKKIIGVKNIVVPAGKFKCFKIQWLLDINKDEKWDNNILFYDYICDKGLIRRTICFKNLWFFSNSWQQCPYLVGLKKRV